MFGWNYYDISWNYYELCSSCVWKLWQVGSPEGLCSREGDHPRDYVNVEVDA